MQALELKVYEIFKIRFSEPEAITIVDFLEKKADQKIIEKKDVFLTKDDKIEIVSMLKDTKAEIIKWMFIFWIGQMAALFAMIFCLLNHNNILPL